MNFFDILSQIEKVDPEVYERLDSRRRVFKHMSGVGQKLAAAAVPMFVGAVFNKAYAQTPANLTVVQVLQFALNLEYLESYFYQDRTNLTGISTVNMNALARIASDEAAHVNFLRTAITGAGGTPVTVARTEFDFTGGRLNSTQSTAGPFANYRTNPDTYLALAQAFEDTGVRAYKGAAPITSLMANKNVLTAALNIHSVEARHASHIRSMRRGGANSSNPTNSLAVSPYSAQPKSWISLAVGGTLADNGGPAPMYTSPVYGAGNDNGAATYGAQNQNGSTAMVTFPSETNTSQGGVALSGTTLTNASSFPVAAFSEAFDEGLDVGTVSAIARGFTIATSTLF